MPPWGIDGRVDVADEQRRGARRRRRKLERTEPDRRATGFAAFGRPASTGRAADERPGDGGLIGQSLENMYRIVEPWRRQGEAFARQWGRAYGALAMPDSYRDTPARLMRSSSDMMSAWVDLLGLYTDCMLPDPESGGGRRSGDGVAVAWRVKSKRPVRLSASLAPGAAQAPLRAPALRKGGVRARFRLGGSESAPGIEIRIKVSDDAADGRHRSAVVDAYTGETLGELLIEVG
jgi:hypothetical protein